MSKPRSTAAVLVLVRGEGAAAEVLLIERSATVNTHKSQVAFPGGAAEASDQNDPSRTALRECFEEVGISPHHVIISKTLSPLPTLTSGFFVVPVLGTLATSEEQKLVLDFNEVAYAEWVSINELMITHSTEHGYPVYRWIGKDQIDRKVWGLTAIILSLIFNSAPDSL